MARKIAPEIPNKKFAKFTPVWTISSKEQCPSLTQAGKINPPDTLLGVVDVPLEVSPAPGRGATVLGKQQRIFAAPGHRPVTQRVSTLLLERLPMS